MIIAFEFFLKGVPKKENLKKIKKILEASKVGLIMILSLQIWGFTVTFAYEALLEHDMICVNVSY